MRTALFWAVTQLVVVTAFRRSGHRIGPHIQGSRKQEGLLSRNVDNELPLNLCVIAQERAFLAYFAAEA
jgi:hypothetical protein